MDIRQPGRYVKVSGRIVFGIEAYDHHDGSSLKNGTKSIELFVDGESVMVYQVDRFAFSETSMSMH